MKNQHEDIRENITFSIKFDEGNDYCHFTFDLFLTFHFTPITLCLSLKIPFFDPYMLSTDQVSFSATDQQIMLVTMNYRTHHKR